MHALLLESQLAVWSRILGVADAYYFACLGFVTAAHIVFLDRYKNYLALRPTE